MKIVSKENKKQSEKRMKIVSKENKKQSEKRMKIVSKENKKSLKKDRAQDIQYRQWILKICKDKLKK